MWIIAALCVSAAVGAGVLLYVKLEGEPVSVNLRGLPDAIRASQEIKIALSDAKSGIRDIRITLSKNDKEIVLFEETFPASDGGDGWNAREKLLTLVIDPKKEGINDGPTVFRLKAHDHSWRNWMHGNQTIIEKTIRIDTRPPVIEVITTQHNINQGGAGLVIYKLSEPCPEHGVFVGENFFPGRPADAVLKKKGIFLCLMALSYSQGKGTPMVISATDPAGNVTKTGFYHYIKNKAFKKDVIGISDNFLNSKMPEFDEYITEKKPASMIEKFLWVNQKLRVVNTDEMIAITRTSANELYWKGEFNRMPSTAGMAGFGDHRDYEYKNQIVDHQVHTGVDLASTFQAPIPAANSGKVAFVGRIGIYGGTVVLDHGFGLFSSYSHLSGFSVEPGQMVSRGDIIGTSGQTGMAGGDHLHFSMMVHNTFVNPVEWWDGAWIKNNITSKLDMINGEIHEKTQNKQKLSGN
jgi:hypothetical protein